jgi:flagellar protein FliS
MHTYTAYQKNAIETSSKEDILLKLFEGAILRLKQAGQLWEDDKKPQAREKRTQALAIITELDNTLDRQNGEPGLVEELEALYGFMIREMNRATLQDEFERLQPVVDTMQTLYAGFKYAVAATRQSSLESRASLSYEGNHGVATTRATL